MNKKKIIIAAVVVLVAVFVLYRSKQSGSTSSNPYDKTEETPTPTNETASLTYVEQLRLAASKLTKSQTNTLWDLAEDVAVEAGKSSFGEEHAYQLTRVLNLPDAEFYYFFNDIWFQNSDFEDLGEGHAVFRARLASIKTRLQKMKIPIK